MRLPFLAAATAIGLALLSAAACSAETGKADVRAEIARKLGIKPADVRESPVPGLWQVASGTDVGYVSADGRFYVDGDIYDMNSHANLTEATRRASRVALLKGVRDEDAIVFAPQDGNVKYVLDVFTDVDCPYCRRLHAEIAQLNSMGVKVRYLMYPRNGPGTASWAKAKAVWCSADRRDALTRAERGEEVVAKACDDPVQKQYQLGREVGVQGTPGIFTPTGDYIKGYMPARAMVDYLKQLAGKETTARKG